VRESWVRRSRLRIEARNGIAGVVDGTSASAFRASWLGNTPASRFATARLPGIGPIGPQALGATGASSGQRHGEALVSGLPAARTIQLHSAVCPTVLGIDEHFFSRRSGYATTFCGRAIRVCAMWCWGTAKLFVWTCRRLIAPLLTRTVSKKAMCPCSVRFRGLPPLLA
jgi:hypothetical protein